MARQAMGKKTLRRLWRETGLKFEGGLHRGGYFLLRTYDHRHFVMSSTDHSDIREEEPGKSVCWTTCPRNIDYFTESARKRGDDEELAFLKNKKRQWELCLG